MDEVKFKQILEEDYISIQQYKNKNWGDFQNQVF